jgi:transcriptional regulator with XRE-family HTH domain
MATIGEHLKQARTQRNVTLEQAAHVTRVRIHYLRALEEDDRDLLPSDVQGRGFLRLYADYLGLPVDPLLDQWMGKIPENVPPSPAPMRKPPSSRRLLQKSPSHDGLDEEPGDDFIEPEEVTPPPAPKKAKKKISPRPAGKVAESAVPMLAEEKFRQIGHQLRKQREQ